MTTSEAIPEGTVTVLFSDLVSSTELNQQLGDERAREVERAVERLAFEHVEAHRGAVIKEIGDGLMVAFTSARRAVFCARGIQQAMAQFNMGGLSRPVQMRIGLHTGDVVQEGGDLHGETVIIAKRIESLAPPGGIYASETVHLVLGTARDQLEDRGQFELKGIATPWRLYEVTRSTDEQDGLLSDSSQTPFVGRQDERQQLLDLITAAANRMGGLVLISGEAGVGKTRLTREAVAEARRLQLTVLTGRCLDMDVPPPYQPIIDQLDEAAQNTTADRLRAAIGENGPELATLMPSLRHRYDDIAEPPSLPPEQERQYVLHGVQEFIERASGARPMVLVYEDLQWADESSLLLLEHLAPRLSSMPILLIGTYRSTDVDPARPFARSLTSLTRSRHALDIRLRPLVRDEVVRILASRAGRTPPRALVDLVWSETEGNPFFVEELFRHLHQAGRLFDSSGSWLDAIEISETEVPESVQLVIRRRLERLGEVERRVLSTAAVIGPRFAFDLLGAISGVTEDELFDSIEAGERMGLLAEVPGGRVARYGFVHEQIRQTLLGDLSRPRRQRLHCQVADSLRAFEARVQSDERSVVLEIANHLELAGSFSPPERTADALLASGQVALDALAFEDAVRLLDRALDYLDEGASHQRAILLARKARALRGTGQVDDAVGALDAALLDLGEIDDLRDRILLQKVELLLDQFRAAETLVDVETVLEHRRQTGDRAAELEALLAAARARYVMTLDQLGFAEQARDTYQAAFDLASELGDRRVMVQALLATRWFADYWADYRPVVRDNLARAIELAKELDDEDILLDAECAGLMLLGPAEAITEGERLLGRLEARRDPLRLKEHCFILMWGYFYGAQFEKCEALCDRAIELAHQLGTAPVQYGSIKALALVERGRFDMVDDALEQEVSDEDHPFGRAMRLLARAVYLERIGADSEAARVILDAFSLATELSRVWMQRWLVGLAISLSPRVPSGLARLADGCGVRPSPVAQAEAFLHASKPESGLALLRKAIPRLESTGMQRELGWALLVLAETHLALGDADQAVAACREGLALAEAAGQASVTWQLHAVQADALLRLGDPSGADERARAEREASTLAARIPDTVHRKAFDNHRLRPQRDASRLGPDS